MNIILLSCTINPGMMQKYTLSIILLAVTGQIFAQGLSFSVVLDPQITWMNSESKRIEREGTEFGFGGGLVTDIFFTDNYAFSSGLFMQITGGSLTFLDSTDFTFADAEETLVPGTGVRYRLRYLTIPFSLKLKANEIGYLKYFANLGLNTHINVRASGDVEPMDIKGEDIKDEVNFFSMSFFIGGGAEYSLGGNTALIGGIYFNSGIWDVSSNPEYNTQVGSVSLRLGVKF